MPKQVKRPLEDRRARFAAEYAKDFNATQAAIRSGYSPGKNNRSAEVQGSRLLSDVEVQAMIQSHHKQAALKTGITVERVQQELARIAFSDARKMFRDDGTMKAPAEWDDDTAAVVAGIETTETTLKGEPLEGDDDREYLEKVITRKIKRWDKGRALAECVAILGMGKSINPAESGGLSITIIPYGAKR